MVSGKIQILEFRVSNVVEEVVNIVMLSLIYVSLQGSDDQIEHSISVESPPVQVKIRFVA